jgi:hypothetical protein
MKVKTDELKKILSKAVKGASYNTFLPLTCFCRIKEETDCFKIFTTDSLNTLIVKGETAKDDIPHTKLDCVVDIKVLSNLISKVSSDTVNFHVANDILNVKANGSYQIPLPLDENNAPVRFPELRTIEDSTVQTIYADNIRDIIKTNKPSLPKTDECAELMNYVFSNTKTVTTDTLMICASCCAVFDETVLFSPRVVETLALFDDCIAVTHDDDYYIFRDDAMTYYAYSSASDAENYPIAPIQRLLDTGFANRVDISGKDLYAALDRINIFLSPYDADACAITVSANELTVTNQNGTCSETLSIDSNIEGDTTYSFKVNIKMLMTQLKSMQDNIVLEVGNEKCIGLEDETSSRIIATLKK